MGFAINTAPMQVIASGTVAMSEEKREALVLDEATLEGAALERSVDRRDEHAVAHRHTRRANGESWHAAVPTWGIGSTGVSPTRFPLGPVANALDPFERGHVDRPTKTRCRR